MNDYEAYRRGDRFYVRIPQSEVPRAETVRGRGFADVKAQKTGDGTVVYPLTVMDAASRFLLACVAFRSQHGVPVRKVLEQLFRAHKIVLGEPYHY